MGMLRKLQIIGFEDEDFLLYTGYSFTVMVNPGSYTDNKGISYNENEAMEGGDTPTYKAYDNGELHLEFTLDATGALIDWKDVVALANKKTISKRVEELEKTVYTYVGDKHEPPYLSVLWGTLSYKGRLKKLDIEYTLFNAEAQPMRAKVKMDIMKYVAQNTQNKEKNKSSPDLSHLVTVKAGDTLPMLCMKIYKSAAYCTEVARINNLTGFRNIIPGAQLFFPPLADE